jgi:hypothetical protein
MDPGRVPQAPLPQSEITSPYHSLNKDTSGTIQPDPFDSSLDSHSNVPRTTARIDTSNSRPYASAGNLPTGPESLSNEKLEVSKISFLQHINDYFAQSVQSPLPVRLPASESNSGERETGMNNERFSNTMAQLHSDIDYIVPSIRLGEKVSYHLDTLNFIYIKIQGGWKTYSWRSSETYHRHCCH